MEEDGLLSSVRTQRHTSSGGCFNLIRSWDVRWEDLMLLAQGKITDFRFR